ncbi:transcriptional regulator FtsR [Actinokineospora iranica]|uniref:MerR family regulatory protein n=1 Tax=Actinokineospora iranica TaxID=1271860 RepID=A0A1G6JJ57_9PSEU|nr:MerR family transcriptional regulator [Actinokineospora iranica]SDC18812.1 MerR family regulatory protein [Actinokineospora iranica]
MTAAGRPAREGLSIGAVLSHLRPDFPDVTISKIRFLESEGLVSPDRTPSGYRRFTEADVARLRFVLAAQRDHYLPLKVIREQLARADSGAPAPRLASVPEPVAAPETFAMAERAAVRLSRDELMAQAGIDAPALLGLEQYGLVKADAEGRFHADAAPIARTVAALAEYGIEPRHLRAFRASADREVGLLEQVVAPMYLQRDPAARARVDEIAHDLAALSVTLHSLLVKASLRRVTGK